MIDQFLALLSFWIYLSYNILMSAATFKNKVVVVSGAGEGIGKNIVLSFARKDSKVVFFDKNKQAVDELKRELSQYPIQFQAEVLNISNIKKVNDLIEKIWRMFGQIDILINNVGIGAQVRFFDITPSLLELVWKTSYRGPFFLTQKVVEKMNEGGNILFISSIHAEHPSLDPAYDGTKAAINSLIANLALQLSQRKIRVNGIAPGHIDTKTAGEPMKKPDVPLFKKAGLPKDIAQACLFLADNQKAGYITGIILPVSGGLHLPISLNLGL